MADKRSRIRTIIGYLLTAVSLVLGPGAGLYFYWHGQNAPKHLDIITAEDADYLPDVPADIPHPSLKIGDKAYDNPYIARCIIHNMGYNPIQPSDFVEPLRVRVEPPWKIIEVYDIPYAPSGWDYPMAHFTWKRVDDQTYEAANTLINPGEYGGVLMYLTSPQQTVHPKFTWSARIINLPAIGGRQFSSDQLRVDMRGPFIILMPYELLATLVLFALFQATYCFLLARSGNLKWGFRSVILIVLSSLISICAAESIVCYASVNPMYSMIYSVMPSMHHLANGPPIVLHVVLVIVLFCLRNKASKKARKPSAELRVVAPHN